MEIKIKESYKNSKISNKKLKNFIEFWKTSNAIPNNIILNDKNELIDGYYSYLALTGSGYLGKVPVSYRDEESYFSKPRKVHNYEFKNNSYRNTNTVYVYGKFSENGKIYIWKLPNKNFALINIGDKIKVNTSYGVRKIVVTDIKVLDKCPIPFVKVKNVKIKNSNPNLLNNNKLFDQVLSCGIDSIKILDKFCDSENYNKKLIEYYYTIVLTNLIKTKFY